jgi:putative aldouronate transport system permease protein
LQTRWPSGLQIRVYSKEAAMKRAPHNTGGALFDAINVLFMALLCLICVVPVFHIIFASFSDPRQLLANSGILLAPLGFTTEGYRLIFSNNVIVTGYLNTLYYVAIGTMISTGLTIMGGYALSRRNLYWGKLIMFLITFTMFFSGGLIPFFLVVDNLGMRNTRAALIIPSAVNAFNLIIMRTSMKGLPESMEESALIDGANAFTVMVRIVVPLSGATVAVVALFYAVGIWNSWFNASIFLNNRSLFPLQLVLKEILVSSDTSAVLNTSTDTTGKTMDIYKPLVKYCTIVAATLPVLCFYPFVQKYFVTGVMIGSIKG